MMDKSTIDWWALVVIVLIVCYCIGYIVSLSFGGCVCPERRVPSDYQSCISECERGNWGDDTPKYQCMNDCQNVHINPCIGIRCEEIESFSGRSSMWGFNISSCKEIPCDCHDWGCALYCMECE